jgi:CRISPR/Cas system CSM-associated protein Csm2 small subunit
MVPLSPETIQAVLDDINKGVPKKDVLVKHGISSAAWRRVVAMEQEREKNLLASIGNRPKDPNAADDIDQELMASHLQSQNPRRQAHARSKLIEVFDDLIGDWRELRKSKTFKPKSYEGFANVLLKMADVIGRLDEDDTLMPKTVHIEITGTRPAGYVSQRQQAAISDGAVTVLAIEDAPRPE